MYGKDKTKSTGRLLGLIQDEGLLHSERIFNNSRPLRTITLKKTFSLGPTLGSLASFHRTHAHTMTVCDGRELERVDADGSE